MDEDHSKSDKIKERKESLKKSITETEHKLLEALRDLDYGLDKKKDASKHRTDLDKLNKEYDDLESGAPTKYTPHNILVMEDKIRLKENSIRNMKEEGEFFGKANENYKNRITFIEYEITKLQKTIDRTKALQK